MTNPISTDPTVIWRDLVAQWEKNVNELGHRVMGSDEFNRSMNQANSVSLALQQTMGDFVGRYLTTLNLPNRADITALGERLQTIERTINRLAGLIEQQAGASQAATADAVPRPPRTKTPPVQPAAGPADPVRERVSAPTGKRPSKTERAIPRAKKSSGQARGRS